MARKMQEKGLVEAGGPGGGGGGPSWRYGSDMGLKGLRPRSQARKVDLPKAQAPLNAGVSSTPKSYPQTAAQRADYLRGSVEQSIKDAGGYPTRGGKPMMTKMQQRMEARKAAAEAEPPSAGARERAVKAGLESFRTAGRQAPLKKKFGIPEYSKGGMVKGQSRDYCK